MKTEARATTGRATRGQRRSVQSLQEWSQQVLDRGEWGPSPAIAAEALGCTPALINRLVADGVLVRNEYDDGKGVKLIVISHASIQTALRAKSKTGTYSGRPPHRPPVGKESEQ